MKTAVILWTLVVLYLCILQAESKKQCNGLKGRFNAGCKQGRKLKIKGPILLRNYGGCFRECRKTEGCMAFDFPRKPKRGKVNKCNLFREGCRRTKHKIKQLYLCKYVAPKIKISKFNLPKKLKINEPICGKPAKDAQGRVIGGKPAVRGQFPWQVGIMRKTTHSSFKETQFSKFRGGVQGQHWYGSAKNLFAHCGGSLLNNRYVLTAAHCFSNDANNYEPLNPKIEKMLNPKRYQVLLGRNDLSEKGADENRKGSARMGIKRIILHPDWDPYKNSGDSESNHYDNDIALLELNKDVKYGDFIKPVCIPRTEAKIRKMKSESCRISGWGHTVRPQNAKGNVNEYNKVSLEEVLQFATFPIVDWHNCSDIFLKKWSGYNRLTKNQFCAGVADGSKDACQGDSGGPFVCSEKSGKKAAGKEKYFQLGVVSFGTDCGRKNVFGQYTKVIKYAEWIEKHAKKRSK